MARGNEGGDTRRLFSVKGRRRTASVNAVAGRDVYSVGRRPTWREEEEMLE